MNSMLRFVPYQSHAQTDGRHVQRACTTCRRRKKRCYHDTFTGDEHVENGIHERQARKRARYQYRSDSIAAGEESHNRRPEDAHSAEAEGEEEEEEEEEEEDDDAQQSDGEARFVGHLNPESTFLAATSPTQTDNIGVWISRLPAAEQSPRHTTAEPHRKNPVSTRLLGMRAFRWEDLAAQYLPGTAAFQTLYAIYLEEIHPLFPVIDQEALNAMPAASPERGLLQLAICIAASVSPRAKRYLRSPVRSKRCSTRDAFIKDMVFPLRLLLSLGLVKDKVVLVQALSLAALFTQYAKDRDLSAELSASAVGYSHTAGLHLDSQDGKNGDSRKPRSEVRCRLFCCVWALDKLNAATNGRPVMMHERDIGRDITDSITVQQPPFQLLLWVVLLLDRVIGLYRPRNERAAFPESEFPLFEDLLVKANAVDVSSRLLATAETLYHSVAMLSCRVKSLDEVSTSSASFLRQSLSAIRATSIVSDGLETALSTLPVIPYAISLSLRVAYRDLRTSRSPMLRDRARAQLLENAAILHRLGGVFGSVGALATMAEQSLYKIDQQTAAPSQTEDNTSASAKSRTDISVPGHQAGQETRAAQQDPLVSNSTTTTIGADDGSCSENRPDGFRPIEAKLDMDLSMFDSMFDLDMFSNFDIPELPQEGS